MWWPRAVQHWYTMVYSQDVGGSYCHRQSQGERISPKNREEQDCTRTKNYSENDLDLKLLKAGAVQNERHLGLQRVCLVLVALMGLMGRKETEDQPGVGL